MQERPAPLARLDSLLSSSVIAHEAIFDTRHELVSRGSGGTEPDELLRESALIARTRLPETAARARSLAKHWDEKSVPDRAHGYACGGNSRVEYVSPEGVADVLVTAERECVLASPRRT
jgi:hypothetical protein